MITFENVYKSYTVPSTNRSVQVLRGVSFSVERSEIFGVIGPSGAGKSTLSRCANALEQPDSGQVLIDGTALAGLPAADLRAFRRRIGVIFQNFDLLSTKTVFENIALPLQLEQQTDANIRDRVLALLELVGLADKATVYPEQLSGGQKQRVAIARAMVHEPSILLCDEATSALDPPTTLAILKLLSDIREQCGVTLLVITHDMQVIKHLCDRVAVLDEGVIVENASVISFFREPQTPLGRALIRDTLRHEIPELLKPYMLATENNHAVPLWRLWLTGHSTLEPVVIEMYERFGLKSNILQANVEWLHHAPTGILLLAIEGATDARLACHQFLTDSGMKVETLGYVDRNAFLVS